MKIRVKPNTNESAFLTDCFRQLQCHILNVAISGLCDFVWKNKRLKRNRCDGTEHFSMQFQKP